MLNPEEVKVIVSEGGDQTEAYTHVRAFSSKTGAPEEKLYPN